MNNLPKYHNDGMMKIALVQPGSWGDNINSTVIFKPIKKKWENSIIDVYTSTLYGSAFHNNGLINRLYEEPADAKQTALHQLVTTPPLLSDCGYDLILVPHPMVNPDKWTALKSGLGTNLICAWVRAMEDNNIDYDLPLESLLFFTESEINKASDFINKIPSGRYKNLMEISGESGQTFWDERWTHQVVQFLCESDQTVFLSCRSFSESLHGLQRRFSDRLFLINSFSIREAAALFNHCDRFFSVSSGLSNACNTNACKKDIKWVEVINSDVVSSAPIRSDGKIFWYDNNLDNFMKFMKS